MSCKLRKMILLLTVLLSAETCMFVTPTSIGSIAITGAEQLSGSMWDTGTVTATINRVSVSVVYGQWFIGRGQT